MKGKLIAALVVCLLCLLLAEIFCQSGGLLPRKKADYERYSLRPRVGDGEALGVVTPWCRSKLNAAAIQQWRCDLQTQTTTSVLSGTHGHVIVVGVDVDEVDNAAMVKEFDDRSKDYAQAGQQGTSHLWGDMSDESYEAWVLSILERSSLPPHGGVHIDLGAGMGKFLAMSHEKRGTYGIGIEPAPTAVCNGWRLFPEVDLRYGDSNEQLALLGDAFADTVTSVGVLVYFKDAAYLCNSVAHSLRVLKPGGTIVHSWITYSPEADGKGSNKLNIHPDFWGGTWAARGTGWDLRFFKKGDTGSSPASRALPACAASIGAQVNPASVSVFTNALGPTNGYTVSFQKKL
jgi:SAM-dependent methyltransferase